MASVKEKRNTKKQKCRLYKDMKCFRKSNHHADLSYFKQNTKKRTRISNKAFAFALSIKAHKALKKNKLRISFKHLL